MDLQALADRIASAAVTPDWTAKDFVLLKLSEYERDFVVNLLRAEAFDLNSSNTGVREDTIKECVVATEIAHQSVVGHYGPEAGIGADVAKRRILNLLRGSASFTVTPEAQTEIQALDPSVPPTERLRQAVEIARKTNWELLAAQRGIDLAILEEALIEIDEYRPSRASEEPYMDIAGFVMKRARLALKELRQSRVRASSSVTSKESQ